ncbi:MAG: hypothetical protein HGA87_02415 [Desulfobulbaceae bacterium]|nr:hypothetical protein [Desulfobulbaceae bacterium]
MTVGGDAFHTPMVTGAGWRIRLPELLQQPLRIEQRVRMTGMIAEHATRCGSALARVVALLLLQEP